MAKSHNLVLLCSNSAESWSHLLFCHAPLPRAAQTHPGRAELVLPGLAVNPAKSNTFPHTRVRTYRVFGPGKSAPLATLVMPLPSCRACSPPQPTAPVPWAVTRDTTLQGHRSAKDILPGGGGVSVWRSRSSPLSGASNLLCLPARDETIVKDGVSTALTCSSRSWNAPTG